MDQAEDSAQLNVSGDDDFLARFHDGDRTLLANLYEQYFEVVDNCVRRLLDGVNRETVVQEFWCRLIATEELRKNYQGGSLAGWLATVARNQAIDFARRLNKEVPLTDDAKQRLEAESDEQRAVEQAEAKMMIDQFIREILPAKWARVFQARFLERLSQREAARAVGISRTTLAYQELRLNALLTEFLVGKKRGER